MSAWSTAAVMDRWGRAHAVFTLDGGSQEWPVCSELLYEDVPELPRVSPSCVSCPDCRAFLDLNLVMIRTASAAVREPDRNVFRGIVCGLLFTAVLAVTAVWVHQLFLL
jgi:hypothetical protein